MSIKNLYFTYLMQKFHDDKLINVDSAFDINVMSNLDDMDYSLLCAIGSACAECYLIDVPIPVKEILESCFIIEDNDIQLNMYWLECIYMLRANEDSPLKIIEKDTKVMELHLRVQLDHLGLTKPGFQRKKSDSMSTECDQMENIKLRSFIASLVKNGDKKLMKKSLHTKVTNEIDINEISLNEITSPLKASTSKSIENLPDKLSNNHNTSINIKTIVDSCFDDETKITGKEEMIDAVASAVKQTLNQ